MPLPRSAGPLMDPAAPPSGRRPRRAGPPPAAAALAAVLLLAAALWWRAETWSITRAGPNASSSRARAWMAGVRGDTLVIYVYHPGDDPEAANNFNFFVLAAMLDDYRCDYVVLARSADKGSPLLPQLPQSGRYLYHDRPCHNWGLVGWALDPAGGAVDWSRHSFFVFLSSDARGPFLPAYLQPYVHWVEPLISRLTDDVRLAASTLSCQASQAPPGNGSSPWRKCPRAALGPVTTDRAGLQLLLADREVFRCHTSVLANAYYSESGAVAAVLKAGFNIDCLLSRFQGVDWRDERNWQCNGGIDPAGPDEYAYDGTWLDPLEAMFVRVKAVHLQSRLPSAVKAAKLSMWEAANIVGRLKGLGAGNHSLRISGNEYQNSSAKYKLPRVLSALVRGMKCFDVEHFVAKNADVRSQSQYPHVVWRFFVYVGQFEDRGYRYTCPADWEQIVKPAF